jgi:hypothetical protein
VPNLNESIAELRQIADGRNDILAEVGGITAGSWYASPATHVGYELIGAGMLILAAGDRGLPMDYDELQRCARVGFERSSPRSVMAGRPPGPRPDRQACSRKSIPCPLPRPDRR